MSGRVLVVDDIATNRMILRTKLAAAYYEVITAENGIEALEKLRTSQPDIVILDVIMPDLDGYEVCRKIKENPETAHIPVVMVTSLIGAKNRLRGFESGADDFLSKPVNDLALFSRVRSLVRVKFMVDELRLRNTTSADLGLMPVSQDGKPAAVTGSVALVGPSEKTAESWQSALRPHVAFRTQVMTVEQIAEPARMAEVPDVFMIHAKPGKYQDGLRLVSQLRADVKTRYAMIILVVPKGAQAVAAKGLDLGASDYIFDPLDLPELMVRLKSLIRRKQMSDQLRSSFDQSLQQALRDPLTGLFNRRYATRHLGKITNRAGETGKPFALMVLDIDNFKKVNDRHGHKTGDLVLQEFSQRLLKNLRGVDLVSRLGGEEFLVAMPDTTRKEAWIAAERLRNVTLRERFVSEGSARGLRITVSIGVAVGDPVNADIDWLLGQADKALYASKSEGRNL